MGLVRPIVNGTKAFQASQVIKGAVKCNAPQEEEKVMALRREVENADWGSFFAQRRTRTLCSPAWSASEERCAQLRALCLSTGARRVLEIGSFVGVSALSMAQVLPDNGEIVSMEIDSFAVDFGLDMKVESDAFWKINHMVGPAWQSLQTLIQQARDSDGSWEPFDLAVIDADKAGMMEYFQILTEVPGLMSDDYVVCVDVTPFKGQLSTPKVDKQDAWLISSGATEIEALREFVASGRFEFCENGGLLQVCKRTSLTMAMSPLGSFPNCYSNVSGDAQWAAPQVAEPVAELRKAVNNADWPALFEEGATKTLASPSWSASSDRCDRLQALCASSSAKRVLEIGSFCGVATLAMAEALPQDGHIVSLDIEPFLVDFGLEIKKHSGVTHKISHMIGSAKDSLRTLAGPDASSKPFDLVVIDADKAGMIEYFQLLWESPGMLSQNAVIAVDITPFKNQTFVPYVKGKLDDWIFKSGQESIDSFVSYVGSLPHVDMSEGGNLITIRKRR